MASKMIEHGFERGSAYNTPGGRVGVLLEGCRRKIIEFYRIARRDYFEWVRRRARDNRELEDQVGNPGVCFTSLDFDDELLVRKLEICVHTPIFDQIHKGVDVHKELTQAIRELRRELQKRNS